MGDRGLGTTLAILASAAAIVYFADTAILRDKKQDSSHGTPVTWPVAWSYLALLIYADILVVWLAVVLLDPGIRGRFVVPYVATVVVLDWCLVASVWNARNLDVIDREAEREFASVRFEDDRKIARGDPPSGIPLGSFAEFRAWYLDVEDWQGRSRNRRRRDTIIGLVLAGVVLFGVLIATVPAVAGW